jgi:hypothetical protein
MTERIIIPDGKVVDNRDSCCDYTHCHGEKSLRIINNRVERIYGGRLTEITAIELAAGTGPVSKALIDIGLYPRNVTCLDIDRSPYQWPHPDINWLYWDLEALTRALINKSQLPETVLAHKGCYDVVTLILPVAVFSPFKGVTIREQEVLACNYFANPGALIMIG